MLGSYRKNDGSYNYRRPDRDVYEIYSLEHSCSNHTTNVIID